MLRLGLNHHGAPNTPREIKHLRISAIEQCMKLGQPIVWRHRFNQDDEEDDYTLPLHGTAKIVIPVHKCPACFDSAYGQVRNDCPVCFGVGWTSVETDDERWINDDGESIGDDDDGTTGLNAPVYGGFGPSVLTWMVEPDVAIDIFKLSPQGALIRTQSATGLAPWYPEMGDNDLAVNVDLGEQGYEIERAKERYELKMVNPQTIRGWGARSRGQEHRVGQTFEMARLPRESILSEVPLDV